MSEDDPKVAWVSRLPQGPADKDSLARVVDSDGGRDEAENTYYEHAADPQYVQEERDQRRYRGSYFRRLRRLGNRSKDHRPDDQ